MTEILSIPGSITKVGAIFPANMSYEEWEACGKNMRGARESLKFYLGDWILFGEAAYGERYSQALDVSDYDYDYLRKIVYVCRNVPLLRRRNNLSFYHHYEVASLTGDEQEAWLSTAEENNWSIRQLREAIKIPKKEDEDKDDVEILPADRNVRYTVNVIIMSAFKGIVEADSLEEAKKMAISEAKSAIDKDEDITLKIQEI